MTQMMHPAEIMNLQGLSQWGGLSGHTLEEADVVLAGIPYDGSAVYRKGAAHAPARMRELSAALPPVIESGRLLQGLSVHDLGDLPMGDDVENNWESVATTLGLVPSGSVLTVMGGDHCSAIPVIAAQARRHPDLAVVWVDAHPDLNAYSRGGGWTCGCALRRALDVSGIKPSAVTQAGGRDFDYDEIQFMHDEGMLLLTTSVIFREPQAVGQIIAERIGDRPVHISFDIDVLDPAFAPGTEIPSAGGLSTRQALEFLAAIGERTRLVGLDVVEVSPPYDVGNITTLAALKLIFEFWGLAWKQTA